MKGVNACVSRGVGARFGFMVSIGVLSATWEMKGKKFSVVKKLIGVGNGGFFSKRNRAHLKLELFCLRCRVEQQKLEEELISHSI